MPSGKFHNCKEVGMALVKSPLVQEVLKTALTAVRAIARDIHSFQWLNMLLAKSKTKFAQKISSSPSSRGYSVRFFWSLARESSFRSAFLHQGPEHKLFVRQTSNLLKKYV